VRHLLNKNLLVALFIACVFAASGCQSYEPQPLDLAAHSDAWFSRTAESEEVMQFAQALREQGRLDDEDFDPTDGLSVREAEVVALVFNPDLRLARLRHGVAVASAEHAGLWEDPTFNVDALYITESVPDPWVTTFGLGITVPLSGRLGVEKARAEAEAAAALERVALAEWRTVQALRIAWMAWSADQLRAEVTEDLVERLDSIVASTHRLAEIGELQKTQATLFALEQATRRNELEALRGTVEVHEQAVRSILGLSPDAPVQLETAISSPQLPSVPEQPVDRLLRANLDLAALKADYEVAEQTLHREIRKQYPDLTIGPVYENEEGQSKIGFFGSIPIPIINANKQAIAEARAERTLARAAYETEFEQIVGQLARARAMHETARRQREDLEATLVPLVDREVTDARQLLELGEGLDEGTALVLLESLVRAYETKLKLIAVRLTEARAAIGMLTLLGPDEPAPDAVPDDTEDPNETMP
jgi:outer membrane protein TolC